MPVRQPPPVRAWGLTARAPEIAWAVKRQPVNPYANPTDKLYGMKVAVEVIPSEEARRRLPDMLRRLRAGGEGVPPFVIGRHRRPEAVLLAVREYEALVERAGTAKREEDPAELLRAKREEILATARRNGARNVRVFGSVARGEADSDSDVDLLVDMEPGWSLLDLGGLCYQLEELLGRPVDVVPAENLKPRIRDRVLREAVRI